MKTLKSVNLKGYVIDLTREQLTNPEGRTVALRPQSFAVLRYLIENVGRIVTKDELLASIWPGLAVTDDSLVQCIGDIRRALGSEANAILKTVPRRGYTLVASAQTGGDIRMGIPSIAVLPFESLDGERGERLADGLTEDVITDLARHPDIFVIARHSVLNYKGRPTKIQEVGHDLGVRYVLEGSLQMSAERVRVTAQLVEALTGTHVWADRYDRPVTEFFELQDALTQAIVNRIAGFSGAVIDAERSLARRKAPESLEAYDLYVLGSNVTDLFTEEGTRTAIAYFERSVKIDPNFARSWHRLAAMHLIDASSGYADDFNASIGFYISAAKRAAELDPNDAIIQAAVAGAYCSEGELEKGMAAYDRALALGPNDADTLAFIAYTRSTKLPTASEDVQLARRAMQLNPFYPDWYSLALGYSCYHARLYQDAINAFSRGRADIVDVNLYLAISYAQLGRTDEAARHRAALQSLVPNFKARSIVAGDAMQNTEAFEHFLDGARKAGLPI